MLPYSSPRAPRDSLRAPKELPRSSRERPRSPQMSQEGPSSCRGLSKRRPKGLRGSLLEASPLDAGLKIGDSGPFDSISELNSASSKLERSGLPLVCPLPFVSSSLLFSPFALRTFIIFSLPRLDYYSFQIQDGQMMGPLLSLLSPLSPPSPLSPLSADPKRPAAMQRAVP